MKALEKELAIKLRKEGKTYSQILSWVPVAKSTLSEWLKGVGLAKAQKQRITELRKAAQRKGAENKRRYRIQRSEEIFKVAEKEVVA